MNIPQWNAAVDARNSERLMRRTKERGGNLDFVQPQPKPGSLHPFKRASELYTAIIETRARLQDNLFELQQELAAFPPYVSWGHGWKGRIKNRTIAGRWNQDRSKYIPHVGKKELDKAAYRALTPYQREVARTISQQIIDEPEMPIANEPEVLV